MKETWRPKQRMKAILRAISFDRLPALGALAALALASLFYLLAPDNGLAGNLLSEAIGIVVAVICLQWLIDARDRRRSRVARFGAYRESTYIYNNIRQTWISVLEATLDKPPETGEDLFSDKYLEEVRTHFDDRKLVSEGLPTWQADIHRWRADIARRIDRVIQRYQANLDPGLLTILQQLESRPEFAVLEFIMPFHLHAYDVRLYREFHATLARLAPEFVDLPGFFRPSDITFADAIDRMQHLPPGYLGKARRIDDP
jgi:hypothetical protein